MISNQSTAGWCLRMWSKWTDRRPNPRPRLSCPRRGDLIRLLPGRADQRRGRTPALPSLAGRGGLILLRVAVLGSAAGGGGRAELLVGLRHAGFVARTGLLPTVALDGNRAASLALAGVVAGAALALAGIAAGAAMGLGGGAGALARAVVLAAGALALAAVEAAATVSILRRRSRSLLLVRRQQTAAQHRTGDHTAKCGQGQLAEVPPADVFVQLLHGFSLL